MNPATTSPSPRPRRPGFLVSWGWLAPALLAAGAAVALSVDVVESTGGVKGDEATYVSMALSIAHDGDLEFGRQDLDRFYRLYGSGPEGIFLKRRVEAGRERLYYGKAWLHAVVAAPFVLAFGLNGLLLLNVLLLAAAAAAGSAFLAARCPAPVARAFTLAFFGASITPLYLVWLTPEMLNVTLVSVACLLWLRKEAEPDGATHGWMNGPRSDLAAAALVGLATFSKPPILALAAPIVALCWWRRRFLTGALAGAAVVLAAGGAFAVNALATGEFNYQGGERRTFYRELTGYPFLHDGRFADGISVSTNELDLDEPLDTRESALVLARNAGYFLVGRHFGFLPFFFPGVVVAACALRRRRDLEAWHLLLLTALVGAAAILLVMLPYSWSGGGGPLGNRYFLSFYPAFLFLAPPMQSLRPAAGAWIGGVLFTAHILVNPFVSAPADLGILAVGRPAAAAGGAHDGQRPAGEPRGHAPPHTPRGRSGDAAVPPGRELDPAGTGRILDCRRPDGGDRRADRRAAGDARAPAAFSHRQHRDGVSRRAEPDRRAAGRPAGHHPARPARRVRQAGVVARADHPHADRLRAHARVDGFGRPAVPRRAGRAPGEAQGRDVSGGTAAPATRRRVRDDGLPRPAPGAPRVLRCQSLLVALPALVERFRSVRRAMPGRARRRLHGRHSPASPAGRAYRTGVPEPAERTVMGADMGAPIRARAGLVPTNAGDRPGRGAGRAFPTSRGFRRVARAIRSIGLPALLAAAAACADESPVAPSPLDLEVAPGPAAAAPSMVAGADAPSMVAGADTAAAGTRMAMAAPGVDASTHVGLKATAPDPVAPAEGVTIKGLTVTLVATSARAKYLPDVTFNHRFELWEGSSGAWLKLDDGNRPAGVRPGALSVRGAAQ